MNNADKINELLAVLVAIRNSCHHPNSDPQLILAAAADSFATLRDRWQAADNAR